MAWLERHYARGDAVEQIHRQSGMSRNHFRRLFRETAGESPRARLTHLRMRAARYHLESSRMMVKEVADAVGIPNVRLFSRQYRRFWGKLPTATSQIV